MSAAATHSPSSSNPASENIDDSDIALMCDIARTAGLDLPPDKHARLDRLIARGWVVPASRDESGPVRYAVSAKGQRFLDARGVGANES